MLEQTLTLNTMTLMRIKVMLKTEKYLCTCGNCVHMPSLEDCAARGFWAGKKNINLKVFKILIKLALQ